MDRKAFIPLAMDTQRQRRPGARLVAITGLVGLVVYLAQASLLSSSSQAVVGVPAHSAHILATCGALHDTPHPPKDFGRRQVSDRFVPGTKPVLLRNARIWTGEQNGTEVVYGSILIENGLIRAIGRSHQPDFTEPPYKDLEVHDVKGAWVTPGIVDAHSHVGDGASPGLEGAQDDNSLKGPTQPWLRSLDGLNTHDLSFVQSIAGGVTTANVLPGSANAIGGQAFTIKLRPTAERTPTAMLLEPAFNINGSTPDGPLRWRQMKQACGENVSRVYGFTRMDTFWAFRKIYNEARKIKESQDTYCERALAGQWNGLGDFPSTPLQYEALVDVLRGRVKVHTHCYEAVDFDGLIRLSQEFKIPIAAVHHAHEAYLVPDLLKSAYDHPPAAAIFALNGRYKREAYRGSEFAARVLNDNGIKVIMKSDHPVMNERDLLYEAQQAFYYGLPENVAIAAVTSTPADVLGYGHRIGYIRRGYDADLVIWDSHPLALGATPKQVFIDGIAQLEDSFITEKPSVFQKTPRVPNFDKEARMAVEYEGIPPILPESAKRTVLFKNVSSLILPGMDGDISAVHMPGTVIVRDGKVLCHGREEACIHSFDVNEMDAVDLGGGAVQPALSTYGAPLGVVEIDQEPSTQDGVIFDPLIANPPKILGGAIPRAVDGLAFQGRDALYAYRFGVTTAFSAPRHYGFLGGLSVAFNTGAAHRLAPGAVIQDVAALHVQVDLSSIISVSTQIAALRRLLLDGGDGELGAAFKAVAKGDLTLVVEAESADVIATLISVKQEVEKQVGSRIKMTIAGGTEAHLLASELAAAHVGVVLVPFRSFPWEWQQRRILPGPPLSEVSAVTKLVQAGVVTAIGVREAWDARNMALYIAWAAIEAGGRLSKKQAMALGTTNLQKLLGAEVHAADMDLVATRGGALFESPLEAKVVGVISPKRAVVDLF